MPLRPHLDRQSGPFLLRVLDAQHFGNLAYYRVTIETLLLGFALFKRSINVMGCTDDA